MRRSAMFVLLALLLGLLAVRCGRGSATEQRLIIFHAGSLTVPMEKLAEAFQAEHPSVIFETEASGSRTAARKVSELGREADLVLSADYRVIDNLLIPEHASWNLHFARNTMVIVYTEHSKYADEISAENWYEVLLREGVVYGHSDPNADPCGYRTLMVWQLAESYYRQPGLYAVLEQQCPAENVRPKAVELLALLTSGDMDYAFEYRSVAEQHGLPYVELPEAINLGAVEFADFYAQARVEVSGAEPETTITQVGAPIVYGFTIPRNAPHPQLAAEFAAFLIGPEGARIMRENGQMPIVPAIADPDEGLPEILRPWVQP